MDNSASSPLHTNVVPSEVGWQFVPQYYTFVNKQPNRLHCFYTKTSTFVHGTEGEDCKPCYGQLEIHNKITSIGFQDCKVYIHSVDAQSSANGGIIIQVIGEMSNHGDPWRKFVQTFFLAEQPNGYFVLNDIFRFLKEESIETDDASEADAAAPDSTTQTQTSEPTAERPPYEPEGTRVAAPSPAQPPPVEEPTALVVPEPAVAPPPVPEPEVQTNGIHAPEPTSIPEPFNAVPEPAPEPVPSPARVETPQPPPVPATANAAAASSSPPAAQAATPTYAAPAPPKTFAQLAAQDHKRWGNAVAQESRGTTEVPINFATTAPPPVSQPSTPSHSHGPSSGRGMGQHGSKEHHPAYIAAQTVATPQVFVKGVTEPVSQTLLTQVLTTRFGHIKDMEIVRSRACAFLEFSTLESARKAIIASLPQSAGGEGGIRIDVGGEPGQVRISVETRKERGERPPNRARGGGPVNGESRGGGGFRGRGGQGRGRGAGISSSAAAGK